MSQKTDWRTEWTGSIDGLRFDELMTAGPRCGQPAPESPVSCTMNKGHVGFHRGIVRVYWGPPREVVDRQRNTIEGDAPTPPPVR